MTRKNSTIIPFQTVLADLLKWLKGRSIVIIGGVAASILGRPRNTQDIDVLMSLNNDEWAELLDSAQKFGFTSRISDALKFAQRSRVFLLKHIVSGIEIDISFGALPFEEECLARAIRVKIAGMTLPIPTPEDLIIMKAVSHRTKDFVDIEAIIDANSKLDLKRIREWVKEFSRVLEMSEIYDDLEKLISKK